jgi:DNA-binding response OmpR family regulator
MEEDRVRGFELGADDYVTKPFSNAEFVLRVEAVLKRCYQSRTTKADTTIQIGQFAFNLKENALYKKGIAKKLTQRESDILQILSKQLNATVKRETILNVVWGNDDYYAGRSLDVFIAKLRKYLKADSKVSIENVHGVGFKLVVI